MPLWRWEPAPYLLALVLVVITSAIRPDTAPVAYWIAFGLTIAAIALLVASIVASARRRSRLPGAGVLRSLEGMEPVEVAPSGGLPTPVTGTHRHQSAIEAASSWGRDVAALLIPDATRWLGMRIRVAVHLVADGHVYHVGFLPDEATARYNGPLAQLARDGRFVIVPAERRRGARSVSVTLDLGGLAGVLEGAASTERP